MCTLEYSHNLSSNLLVNIFDMRSLSLIYLPRDSFVLQVPTFHINRRWFGCPFLVIKDS